jgi:hypothetical protein
LAAVASVAAAVVVAALLLWPKAEPAPALVAETGIVAPAVAKQPAATHVPVVADLQVPNPAPRKHRRKPAKEIPDTLGSSIWQSERNVLMAKRTGANNIALTMKWQELDYDIDKSQQYLVVRGANLQTTSGASYLWWLNGSNHGTQVAPVSQREIEVDGQPQVVIAWNLSTSGLYENFSGDRPSVCMGQTIFGMTASTADGSCEIYDIDFVADVDNYMATTRVGAACQQAKSATFYSVTGMRTAKPHKGIYIRDGRKYMK